MQEVNSQNDKFGNCHGRCSYRYALNKLYLFHVWCVQCKEVRLVFRAGHVLPVITGTCSQRLAIIVCLKVLHYPYILNYY